MQRPAAGTRQRSRAFLCVFLCAPASLRQDCLRLRVRVLAGAGDAAPWQAIRRRGRAGDAFALLDGAAGGSVRALIVPKAHIAGDFELPDKLRTACWLMVDRVRWLLLARSGRGTKRNAKAQRGKGAKGYTMLFVALWPGVRLWLVGRGKCRSHTETQRHEGGRDELPTCRDRRTFVQ